MGPPTEPSDSGSGGERTSTGMDELSAMAGSEGYGGCEDDMEYGFTYCKGCGRAIRFVKTKRGAWMPCESFPVRAVPDGDGVLLYNEDGTSFRGRVVDEGVSGAERAYEPHFARCSNPVGVGGKKKESADEKAARLQEARERAGAEYQQALAREMEKREREWRTSRA